MDTYSNITVLVLAGTKWQVPLVQKLKEKGCYVVVFNLLPDSPAFAYADEFCVVDILDRSRCLELARGYAPDAILSDECDVAVPMVAYLSQQLGLISIGAEMAQLYTNKYKMRTFGEGHGFPTPAFYKCGTQEEALKIFRGFGKKMILKPIDANSSRGVYSVTSADDIAMHFAESVSFSKTEESILLEEYIEGTEFTVDGIKTEKGHLSLVVSEKKHYSYNENIASALYFSHYSLAYDYGLLKDVNDQFVELSGLPYGLTHAEYKYRDGKFYLIEIGARGGGNQISDKIVPLLSGLDTYQYLIDKTLGRSCKEDLAVSEKFLGRCAVLRFLGTNGKEGRVKEIRGRKFLEECKFIVDYGISCKEGSWVSNASDDSQRIGYYIAYGENAQELETVVRQAEDMIHIVLEGREDMASEKEFLERVGKAEVSTPIWRKMKQSKYPFVIWGMGSLSVSIKKYLDAHGIEASAYWVDGELDENQKAEGKNGLPVLALPEVIRKYDKFNVVFGHSRYEKKVGLKGRYKNIEDVFCIPNVCYHRFQRMEKSFFIENAGEYYKNFCLLEDEASRECMIAYLKCKISENIDDILTVFGGECLDYFDNPIFSLGKNEVYVDVGAYTGDTIELFLKASGYKYEKIFAYEPNGIYAHELKKYVQKQRLEHVSVIQKGTWNEKDVLHFNYDEESSGIARNVALQEGTIEVDTLDHMLEGEHATLVKINFLEGVKETIEGMKNIMDQDRPKLAITVGFDEYALLTIPILINKINPMYKLYLRFAAAMPSRLLLFAV